MPHPFFLLERPALGDSTATAARMNQQILWDSTRLKFVKAMSTPHLSAVFQPILDMQTGTYFAYEGLIRGPQDTLMHSPAALFAMAKKGDVVIEFEKMCREVILKRYAELALTQRLFLNASIPCLTDSEFRITDDIPLLTSLGISPGRVTIEITENHLVTDFSALRDTLGEYRNRGFEFAMDDLGEGFSNLRMWSEVRPEFVKIDRHFISGIATDPLKFQLVKAMQQIAETCDAQLVAEGVETESEFTTVRDLGIRYTQGYLIARPDAQPAEQPPEHIKKLLSCGRIIVFPRQHANSSGYTPVSQLTHAIEPVSVDTENDVVYTLFESQPNLLAVPVVKDDIPIGMINRFSMIDGFARPYRRELYGKKSCALMMDKQPVIIESTATVQDLARKIGSRDQQSFSEGFIITQNGRYAGIGWSRELMGLITDMQMHSARYANPLTLLPGNVPINEHIERLLVSDTGFVACYADLDAFKPYNDVYGYRRGDDVIVLLSQILGEIIKIQDDFLGHIGGDDFMILFQSHDWEARCQHALTLFDQRIADFLEPEHRAAGSYTAEDRRGQMVGHALPSLSLGAVMVGSGEFHSHQDVAAAVAEAKHQAKRIAGSSLFVERRNATKSRQ